MPSPPRLFLADPQRPAGHRGRPRQPGACRAVGSGPHARPRTSRDLGRRHRRRRIGACRVGRAMGAGRSTTAGDGEDQVVYRAGARHVPRLVMRLTPPGAGIGRARIRDSSSPGHRRHRQHRSASDPAARRMGAGTVVAVSRNPGARLDELGRAARVDRDDAGRRWPPTPPTRPRMAALFDRFGTELPRADGHLPGGVARRPGRRWPT